ncbi:MAG: Efflux ABC transporter, ATP-binding protein [uncultured Chloroflexia bacterium]|uniref:Efflux ABC transporter, ATP-binding protein n=1 Tax=uncultured Chloroflexia bacterium TaxID=1672391 RepID=A0A6J4K2V2_9CHLR|nr:MAG: Efflux ABC transporter, ATP-binding protein [uncultured Chloroflexia bacterium]
MSDRTIVTEQVVKRFGKFTAVDGVSFAVEAGEIFGFLGPNGAGKSTTIGMLTTLTLPSAGRATVGGHDVVKQAADVRRVAGVALQEIGLDPLMKSVELLSIQGQLFGLSRRQARERAGELLDLVKLQDVVARPVGKYSGGMKRRLDLALALVHAPEILFLDEPTTGLDPASRRDVWTEIRRLNRDLGMTIFLTTQYLEEADELADRVAIINHGKIAVEGTPEALKARVGNESINVTFADDATVAQAQTEIGGIADRVQIDRQTLRLYLPRAAEVVPAVVSQLQARGLQPRSLTLSRPSLDDVFLQVTGERYANEVAA